MIEPSLVSSCIFNLVKQILLAVVPYAALLKIIWDMPDGYPFNDKKIDTEGMVRHYDRSLVIYLCASCSSTRQLTLSFKDPNLLELTAQEMNFRSSFDAPNESIARRRSTLTLRMEAMGISTSQLNKSAKALGVEHAREHALKSIPKEQRLSTIIMREAIEASGAVAVKSESKEPQEVAPEEAIEASGVADESESKEPQVKEWLLLESFQLAIIVIQ